MSVILVAEEDAGSAEQIANLLRSEGWRVEIVSSRNDALRAAAARQPALFLASATLPEASSLLAAFSRRRGGPGSIALVGQAADLPEGAAKPLAAEDYQADEWVAKPCSPQVLVRTVRRCLTGSPEAGTPDGRTPDAGTPAGRTPPVPEAAATDAREAGRRDAGPRETGPPAAETSGQQLTSADIFGDVLAEVEAEAQREKDARRARTRTRRTQAEEIERKLEETLSGVIPGSGRPGSGRPGAAPADGQRQRAKAAGTPVAGTPAKAAGTPAAPVPAPEAPAATTPAVPAVGTPDGPRPASRRPAKRSLPTSDEIDDLLDKTLSSLDLSSRPKRPKTSTPRPAAASKPEAALPPEPPVARRSPTPARPAASLPAASPPAASPPRGNLPEIGPPVPEPPPAAPVSPARGDAPAFEPPPPVARPAAPAAREPVPSPTPDVDTDVVIPAPPAFEPPAASPIAAAGHPPISSVQPRDALKTQRLPVIPIVPERAISRADAAAQRAADRRLADRRSAEAQSADRRSTDRRSTDRRIGDRWQAADGKKFGEYTLLERVAVGGMAEVWRARRRGVEGFQKTVAIKKILAHLIDSPDFVDMFIDEAKLAAQLNHHNIIQIYDLGKVGDDFFIAMEYVDGKDLRSILNAAKETGQPPPLGLALLIVGALARALDYAHRKRDFDNRALGLVHRDVSPQNVLISYEGEIKLCDFGIVKAVSKASTTQMGALKGKLQYMSPEQAWGRSVDARSDIFSLGSVLFEVLTGIKLFAGDSEIGVLDAVRECRVRSPRETEPAIPESVERIVFKALTKSPEDRYQTAGEMEHDIKAALDELKPTPSLKDLAAFLDALFRRPEAVADSPLAAAAYTRAPAAVPEAAAAIPEPEGRTPEGRTPEGRTPEGRTPDEPAAEPEGRTPDAWQAPVVEPEGRPPEAWSADVPETPAPAPPAIAGTPAAGTPDRGTPDRGAPDRRGGKRILVIAAAAVLAILLAGAGWLVFLRPAGQAPDTPDRGETPPPVTHPAGEVRSGAPSAPSGAPEEVPPGTETEAAPGDATVRDTAEEDDTTAFPADLEEMVAEEVLKRREEMERDFETKKRRLEKEIEKAKDTPEPPPGDPAPEAEESEGRTGGGGER